MSWWDGLRCNSSPLATAALVAARVLPAAASADSVVFAKGGNPFLESPDGAKGYQGRWSRGGRRAVPGA